MNLAVPASEARSSTTSFATWTIQGARRNENGDRYLVADRLAMVADGISSSRIGADSAAACVERLEVLWHCAGETVDADQVRTMLDRVNGHLLSRAMMLPSSERRRGGCCVAGVVLDTDCRSAIVFHAGDASVHVSGKEGFRKLTKDHCGVSSNRIRSALGIVPNPVIDVGTFDLEPGEYLIITTDGCDFDSLTTAQSYLPDGAPEGIVERIRHAKPSPTDDATVVVLSTDGGS